MPLLLRVVDLDIGHRQVPATAPGMAIAGSRDHTPIDHATTLCAPHLHHQHDTRRTESDPVVGDIELRPTMGPGPGR